MSLILRAAVLGVCAVSVTCADAPPAVQPSGFACPQGTRFVVTGSVEGPQTWLVCCKPKPESVGRGDALACGPDEVPDGPSLLLFSSGHARVVGAYRDGLGQGPVTFWSDAGKLVSTGEYANGKMDGTWTYFRDNGVAENRRRYTDGLEEGIYERWFEDGRLEETGASRGGKASGQRRVFFRSGMLELEERYVAGELDGLQRRFHENGRLEREGAWRDGKEEGTFASWHANGARASVEQFAGGDPVGRATWWDEAGNVVTDGGFKDGKRDGEWLEQRWSGPYTLGERNGTWTDGTTRVVWEHGLEGPIRPCPAGSTAVIVCAARCCDFRARFCQTSSGERSGPFDKWDTSGRKL